ncbi:hypothetical protein PCYB_011370 [Plasmodium cynomolgi strain B]|uniref:Uncharacterized protein n=1 Tax=Plasmodium cynomolgi (strain B) TaxID=1120755 RepID=K6UPA5_PLACD|nr:hypothetical protein PCYB_011370 [Plasmodium cynomolgi strain B]GAB64404.1 hypothetical protein PCYB_011370 [Plasmodium cynomolgi strain B]
MSTKSNEDIDNKEDKNIEKVLRKEEVTIEDVSSSNALGESLTDSRNGKGASRGKYVRRNSSSKEPSKAVKKACFFDQEYYIREIPKCPISEMLLKRKKKK